MIKANILLVTLAFVLIGTATGPAQTRNQEIWITGACSNLGKANVFQVDKPVSNNPTGKIVYLGVQQNSSQVNEFIKKACEKNMTLRLFGYFVPAVNKNRTTGAPMPTVAFIATKFHMPNEPDVLPLSKILHVQ